MSNPGACCSLSGAKLATGHPERVLLMNVANALQQSASFYGSKPLLYFRDQPLSFFEFGLQARKAKAILEGIGTAPGDRVAILAGNKPEWLASYFPILPTPPPLLPLHPS